MTKLTTQIMTKLENFNGDKTEQLKLQKKMVCDKTKNFDCDKTKKNQIRTKLNLWKYFFIFIFNHFY